MAIYLFGDTNENVSVVQKLVRRNLKVKRSGTLADTTRGVVVRTVAGAEPAVVVTSVGDGNATQVSTNTQKDKVLSGTGNRKKKYETHKISIGRTKENAVRTRGYEQSQAEDHGARPNRHPERPRYQRRYGDERTRAFHAT
jgi:hypothetical protein